MKKVLLLLSLLATILLSACGPGPTITGSGTGGGIVTPPPPPFPTVTGFSPTSGTAGTTVIITGTDFDPTPANNTVKFGGVIATVTVASTTSLTVTVPSLAPSGTITVTTAAGTGTSGSIFIVNGPGTLTGDVRDAFSTAVLSGVTVAVSGVPPATTTDANGIYTVADLPNANYSLNVSNTGYISEVISNFAVWANVTSTVETVHLVATPQYAGPGTVSGTVNNAFTGLGLPGVTLNFRSSINTTTGPTIASTTTDASGNYIATLNGGNYTAEAILPGYTTAYFTVTSLGTLTSANQNGTINPTLPAGQTRVILTWGASPSDLDSHMTGPLSGSTSRFHVYFASRGSSTATPFVNLDVDDVSSYGPETTTIYQQTAGTYNFSVYDYSNGGLTSSFALSASGAKVRVYNSTGLIATFNVPANRGGTLWSVFELNGNTIIPVSTMTYASSSSTIP
jgi:hypothetical protein